VPVALGEPMGRGGAGGRCDGQRLTCGLERALERLEAARDEIDDLNVFPVPDGDTGSNMFLTLQAACSEIRTLPGDPGVAAVTAAAAQGSLMGARGNSGVILSQILRGFAQGCRSAVTLDGPVLATALGGAAAVAHRAVKKPKDGTILSVMRDAASAAAAASAGGAELPEVLIAATREAWAAVERSPEQLEVLRQAGVVDAGGFGLAVILEGLVDAVAGSRAAAAVRPPAFARPGRARSDGRGRRPGVPAGAAGVEAPVGGFGYCTEFLLLDGSASTEAVEAELGGLGESAMVVGDPGQLHVHLHTPEPWVVLARAARLGRIERLKVEDMTAQHHEVRARGRRPASGNGRRPDGAPVLEAMAVVAVAQGTGFRAILEGLGAAQVVEGGQSMNPSTEDLLRAVTATPATTVFLLPNNGNLLLAADQVAAMADREVVVIPTRNVPQGISALLAFDRGADGAGNRQRMTGAIETIHALEVTTAVRDSQAGGRPIRCGDILAVVDGEIQAVGASTTEVVLAALTAIGHRPADLITVYRGAGATEAESADLARAIAERFPAAEIERQDGGQEHYPFVLSVE